MFVNKLLLLISIVAFQITHIVYSQPCATIDPTKVDYDGMPFCPSVVDDNSAFSVYRCALDQVKEYHFPTQQENKTMNNLLMTLKDVDTNGISKSRTSLIKRYTNNLNLQVCRYRQDKNNSYLLMYTQPGISNYSGPFIMFRETNSSKIIILSPHDDTDGTYADTKFGLSKTNAKFCISNGHRRKDVNLGLYSDMVHTTPQYNLGTYAIQIIGNIFKGHVWYHIHGMKNDIKVLYRSRSTPLSTQFEKAIEDNSNITTFDNLNAGFTIDEYVNTNYYLKTEMPASLHINNKMIIASIVKQTETQPWAWN